MRRIVSTLPIFFLFILICSCSGEETAFGFSSSSSSSSIVPTVSVRVQAVQNAYEGLQNGKLIFTLSAVTNTDVTVFYSIDSTSIAKQADLNPALTGSVIISAGSLTTNLTVYISNDLLVEGTEDLVITLDRTDNFGVGVDSTPATIKIIDNDSYLSTVSLPETVSFTEGSTGSLTVTMSQPIAVDLVAYYTVLVSSTLGNTDYIALPGSVTIAAGSTTTNIAISTVDDMIVEGSEKLIVVLYDTDHSGVTINSRLSTITVLDNDTGLVSIRGMSDAQEGSAAGDFSISLNQPASFDVTVSYAIQQILFSYAGFTDVMPLTGTITIPAGQLSVTFPVIAVDDSQVEGTEPLAISITGTDNPNVLVNSSANIDTILIFDND